MGVPTPGLRHLHEEPGNCWIDCSHTPETPTTSDSIHSPFDCCSESPVFKMAIGQQAKNEMNASSAQEKRNQCIFYTRHGWVGRHLLMPKSK